MTPEQIACADCGRRKGEPCRSKGRKKSVDRQKPHDRRVWEANILSCIEQYGTHDWKIPIHPYNMWDDSFHETPRRREHVAVSCTRCPWWVTTAEMEITPDLQAQRDALDRTVEEAIARAEEKKVAYLAACHVLKWEEHYSFEFVLAPREGNPFGTSTGGRDRWEVIENGKHIGRITEYAEDEWAAYSYRIDDDYQSRIGFYDTKADACKALSRFRHRHYDPDDE